jgi:hypothetical protein
MTDAQSPPCPRTRPQEAPVTGRRRVEATPDSSPSAPPSRNLREFTGLSRRGQRVTLAEAVGTYVGAQP